MKHFYTAKIGTATAMSDKCHAIMAHLLSVIIVRLLFTAGPKL